MPRPSRPCWPATSPRWCSTPPRYNQVDVAEEEPQAAYLVNALAVRNLALACRQVDSLLVHYSTDYVFDGQAGRPYAEEDRPHPLGAYAVSKLAGELYAQAYLDRVLIVRTSGVFGPGGLATRPRQLRRADAAPGSAPGSRSAWWKIISPPRPSPRCWPPAPSIWWSGGRPACSILAEARPLLVPVCAADLRGRRPPAYPHGDQRARVPHGRAPAQFSALSNAKMERLGIAPMPPLREALEHFARRGAATELAPAPPPA